MNIMCVKITNSEPVHGHCPVRKKDAEQRVVLPCSPQLTDHTYTLTSKKGQGWQSKFFVTNCLEIFVGFLVWNFLNLHPNNLSYFSSPSNIAKNYNHQYILMNDGYQVRVTEKHSGETYLFNVFLYQPQALQWVPILFQNDTKLQSHYSNISIILHLNKKKRSCTNCTLGSPMPAKTSFGPWESKEVYQPLTSLTEFWHLD